MFPSKAVDECAMHEWDIVNSVILCLMRNAKPRLGCYDNYIYFIISVINI